jgi:hypothetical protein
MGVRGSGGTLRRLIAAAALALGLPACSSDFSVSNLLPRANTFVPESLSLGSAAPAYEVRPATAADLVDQQGQCAGSGGPAGPEGAQPGAPVSSGGIALQMTECDVVRRAGPPDQIELGSNERGERALTLTYIHGPRPGVYRFAAGRLASIERGPQPPAPPPAAKPKPAPKKPAPA